VQADDRCMVLRGLEFPRVSVAREQNRALSATERSSVSNSRWKLIESGQPRGSRARSYQEESGGWLRGEKLSGKEKALLTHHDGRDGEKRKTVPVFIEDIVDEMDTAG